MRIDLEEAVFRLKKGEVVALPTETVYGLAATLTSKEGIRRIFELKGRPQDNPLIIHLHQTSDLEPYVSFFPEKVDLLTKALWPGPLTLVLPIKEEVIPPEVTAHLATGAFRVPKHSLVQKVLKETGPLVMPSANLSGRPSATSASHVEADFGASFPVLDGGSSRQGVESTILYFDKECWKILRLGAISRERIFEVLQVASPIYQGKAISPGQKYRHYAPKAILHLSKVIPDDAKAVIGFEDRSYPRFATFFSLGESHNPKQALHCLYDVLRRLDQDQVKEAWVDIAISEEGLFETLLERLHKACGDKMSVC